MCARLSELLNTIVLDYADDPLHKIKINPSDKSVVNKIYR